jgi:hypothetical protein
MTDSSLLVRAVAELLVVAVLAWVQLGRLRRVLADAVAPR